jgi:hypothetical protein
VPISNSRITLVSFICRSRIVTSCKSSSPCAYSRDDVYKAYTDPNNLQPEGQSYNSSSSAKPYNTDNWNQQTAIGDDD